MKKLIVIFILFFGHKVSFAQFLIQASSPVDVCYPFSVTLSVVTPQPGYGYTWFLGGYGCPNTGSAAPYNNGSVLQALITGEFYCMGMPPGGGLPEISNAIIVRVLPGMPGSLLMPAPGLYTGNSNCVTSASFCIPSIYYQNWPGTIIKWYKNNMLISGATSGSYTATSEGYYKYTITSGCVTALSDSTLMTTIPISTITPSGATTFCANGSILLNANTGAGLTYQWKNNGTNISGATSSGYTATSSGSHTVQITNSCGSSTSSPVVVTVNPNPSAAITPSGPVSFCSGGSVTLNAPVAANRTYQWKKNSTNISGATLSSYIATASGTYKVIVTNTLTGCSKTTATGIVVTKNPLPAATIIPAGTITFCAGQNALLTANSGTGYTYKWKKNGSYISGATAMTYTVTTAGNYRVEVTNSYGCTKTSSADTVVVPCKEGENIFAENNFDVTVYPNPSSGDFVFEINNATSDYISIEVFDVIGKLVLGETTMDAQFTIHNSQLSPGIYSVTVTIGETKKTLKIVKTE